MLTTQLRSDAATKRNFRNELRDHRRRKIENSSLRIDLSYKLMLANHVRPALIAHLSSVGCGCISHTTSTFVDAHTSCLHIYTILATM
jgi:hypothetical protein